MPPVGNASWNVLRVSFSTVNDRGGKVDGVGTVGFGLRPFLLLAGGAEKQESRKYVSLLHLDVHFIVKLQIS